MNTIKISSAELQSGTITPEHLAVAVEALSTDGYIVLEDVVDLDHVAVLREKMTQDVEASLRRPDAAFNFNRGNIQQNPPPYAPYLFRDVLVNDIAIAVTHAILGNGLKNGMYSGNTAIKADGKRQPVHADIGQLWPNVHATPAFAFVVNVPVVDMTPENGSTEIWPGTHLDNTVAIQDEDIKVSLDVLEDRRRIVPPFQPSVKAGSIVIRDIRMWHAGMPNLTDQPRPMIAMIHYVSWFPAPEIEFADGSQAILEHPILKTSAKFVQDKINYIEQTEAYEFQAEK
ncbi:hypothetical protein CCAX7_25450 [Capsulimonas corticalis]|uniref:Uncharacterized protein n=1 Tax=Capsulimonas corticalis TaxID=2219043 RepID=A0A402CVQ7_9BACT|nr:phytanoyl-CoA dioxygenase family protein [Capsulimonas corticalis]BDI30494.1 hypothetical protein CCAX7_25450 [Capsulimonas corticalis]